MGLLTKSSSLEKKSLKFYPKFSLIKNFKIAIVGSGISGLITAIKLADSGYFVTLFSKKNLDDANTSWAQGGIAGVLSPEDNSEEHIADTMICGSQLNDLANVTELINNSKKTIEYLESLGVIFDRNENNELDLTREGGHSRARIAHAKDQTGLSIEQALIREVKKRNKNIEVQEQSQIVDLIRNAEQVLGVVVLANGELTAKKFGVVVLATGGVCQVYNSNTNPGIATGDGIAIAYRNELKLQNLEFIQFHPTVFFADNGQALLITEALRGEGAILVDEDDERFLEHVHPLAELAPRDFVAMECNKIINRGGKVFLKLPTGLNLNLGQRFPYLLYKLKEFGYNLASDRIPVRPAAHFSCGGILVDNLGQTKLNGLLAYGEVADFGIHGANRLASNSLLEAAYFSSKVDIALLSQISKLESNNFPIEEHPTFRDYKTAANIIKHSDPELVRLTLQSSQKNLGAIMDRDFGVARNNEAMNTGLQKLLELEQQILGIARGEFLSENNASSKVEQDNAGSAFALFIETLNLVQVAIQIAEAAIARKESIGCHQVDAQ